MLVGAAVSLSLMTLLSVRMRPLAAIVAETQAENTIHQVLEEAVLCDLVQMGVSYGNLVSIERDSTGAITALTTDVVELNLQAPSAAITKQPSNAAVVSGKTIQFQVTATGTDLTYQWYRSNDNGATWTKTYLGGYNTNTLSFAASASRAALYKCQITDGSGTIIWSNAVKLQILSAELKILTQPVNMTCANGATATFTVEAQGDGLKYQWYSSADGGETWTASYLTGYNTATFSFAVNATRASRLYKCVITDAGGNVVETNYVSVTIG